VAVARAARLPPGRVAGRRPSRLVGFICWLGWLLMMRLLFSTITVCSVTALMSDVGGLIYRAYLP